MNDNEKIRDGMGVTLFASVPISAAQIRLLVIYIVSFTSVPISVLN